MKVISKVLEILAITAVMLLMASVDYWVNLI